MFWIFPVYLVPWAARVYLFKIFFVFSCLGCQKCICEDAGRDPCQVAIAEVHQREPEWSEDAQDTENSISQALTKMGFHGNCSCTLPYPAKLREPKIVVKSGQNHVSNRAFLREALT